MEQLLKVKVNNFLEKYYTCKNNEISLNWDTMKISNYYLEKVITLNNLKEDKVKNEIYNQIFKEIDEEIEKKINLISKNIKENFKEIKEADIIRTIKENFSFKVNFEEFLKNTYVNSLYISLGEKDLSSSYFNNTVYQKENLENIKNKKISDEIVKEKFKNSDISFLINSQGYKIEDLFNNEKKKNSIFLNSLNEILERKEDLSSKRITFIFKKLELKDLINSFKNENLKISSDSQCNLFDSINGKIIERKFNLEKDVILKKDRIVDLGINENNLGFSPYQFLRTISLGKINSTNKIENEIEKINIEKIREKIETKIKINLKKKNKNNKLER